MDRDDSNIIEAERDADPEAFRDYDPGDKFEKKYEALHADHAAHSATAAGSQPTGEAVEEAERPTSSRSSSSVSSVQQEEVRSGSRRRPSWFSRVTTNKEAVELEFLHYLDRHPTAVKRMQDHRLQHSQTVGSSKVVDGQKLPKFGGNKPYPPPLPEREEYVVEFDGHEDPDHGQNWALKRKLIVSAVLVFDSLAATFASSVFSAAATYVGEEFHKGREVTTLGTSLFVLGYALGPTIWAPLSELYGRRLPVIVAAFGFGVFNIGVAVAKDYQTLMICRFFAGTFGACPLTLCAAVFADIYNNHYRGLAVAVFAAMVICGPLIGPFIGGFISKSYLGWRWTAYIPAFMGFTASILAVFFQDESYGPVILVSKASELRRLTRNWGIHAKQEEVEVSIKELVVKNVSRPVRILFTEPIVLLVTIYLSFIYGLLYLSLTAYGIVFGQIYGFSPGVSGLPYFGMIVGVFIGLALIAYDVPAYAKKLEANNNIPVPEWRLPITMVGGVVFCIGLFWFGWTGFTKDIHWIVPTIAGSFIGFGIYTVFLQCLNYLVDAYLMFAASAVAANTMMRSLFGAVFPLFGYYMYEGIGVQWGQTFLGCLALLFIPMPFLFYYKGKSIRAKSKFAPAPDIEQDKRRDLESKGRPDDEQSQANGNGAPKERETKETKEE